MRRALPTLSGQSLRQAALLDDLRQRIAGLERRGGTRAEQAHLSFGHPGVAGEIGGRLTLIASRRLQLAAEASGMVAVALRRSRRQDDPALLEPSAATTRWRVTALPSGPPLPHAPGLPRARWRLELVRCRGGEAFSWVVEACDAQGRLGVVPDLVHGQAAPEWRRATA